MSAARLRSALALIAALILSPAALAQRDIGFAAYALPEAGALAVPVAATEPLSGE